MRATTHPRNGHPDEFALRPSQDAITAGAGRVERDSNGDGWFDARDTQGVQDLNDTFKIHRGSRSNTDSAGCQTIGGGEYDDFVSTVRGTPGQNRWQYVLTSVAPGQARELGQDVPLAANDDPVSRSIATMPCSSRSVRACRPWADATPSMPRTTAW
jgi:hypothetical protein